jgi:hypothetical protein
MTPEEHGKDIARRLAAGMAASRTGPAGTPALLSDDDIRKLVDKVGPIVGRRLGLRRDDDDGLAGALVPA